MLVGQELFQLYNPSPDPKRVIWPSLRLFDIICVITFKRLKPPNPSRVTLLTTQEASPDE